MEEILKKMTLREKTAFLMCLAQFTSEELTTEEVDYIIDIALMCEYPEDKFEFLFKRIEDEELLTMLSDLTDATIAKILIRELFYLGYADKALGDEELLFIMDIAQSMKISTQEVERISDWVSVGMEWEKLGDELFGPSI